MVEDKTINILMVSISRVRNNGSYTTAPKPIKYLELVTQQSSFW